jgi:hypothetical protein
MDVIVSSVIPVPVVAVVPVVPVVPVVAALAGAAVAAKTELRIGFAEASVEIELSEASLIYL